MKRSLKAETFVYPTPVWIVGTYGEGGRPNGATVAWGGVCCSDPPCVAISLRKARYTYGNILKRKAFTVSVPSQAHVKEADYFGIVSGADRDKFAASGWTPVKSSLVDAPYVEEAPVVLECRLLHTFELGAHTQFVGQIVDVKADEAILTPEGFPDIEKLQPILFAPGTNTYHVVGEYLGKAFSIGREIQTSSQNT